MHIANKVTKQANQPDHLHTKKRHLYKIMVASNETKYHSYTNLIFIMITTQPIIPRIGV